MFLLSSADAHQPNIFIMSKFSGVPFLIRYQNIDILKKDHNFQILAI